MRTTNAIAAALIGAIGLAATACAPAAQVADAGHYSPFRITDLSGHPIYEDAIPDGFGHLVYLSTGTVVSGWPSEGY